MPVHRHQHGSRGTVYAFTDEIDGWLASRQSEAAPDSEAEEPAALIAAPPTKPAVVNWAGASRRVIVTGLTALVVVATLSAVLHRGSTGAESAPPPQNPILPRRVTTLPGLERFPALSPDGKRVAFAWRSPASNNFDIYVKPVDGEELTRISSDPADESAPRWSADGKSIAYMRPTGESDEFAVVLHSLNRQADWIVGKLSTGPVNRGVSFDFEPGNREYLWLLHRRQPSLPQSLDRIHTGTDARATAIEGRAGKYGFLAFALSPDGGQLAVADANGAIWQPTEIRVRPVGQDQWRQLTDDFAEIYGLTWMPDGGSIVFSSTRKGPASLWLVAADAPKPGRSAPVRLTSHFGEALYPSAVKTGKGTRIAYQLRSNQTHLWLKRLGRPDAPLMLTTGPAVDTEPAFSPQADHVAFVSDRSGLRQAWTVGVRDRALRRITNSKSWLGSPGWSPGGGSLLFLHGNDVASAGLADPVIHNHTHGYPHSRDAGWNPDGSLYYVSNRSGAYQVWMQPLNREDQARQLTHVRGQVRNAWVDPGLRTVCFDYLNDDPPGVWAVPAEGGEATVVVRATGQVYWKVRGRTIFHVHRSTRGTLWAQEIGQATGRVAYQSARPIHSFDVSRDGRSLVYAVADVEEEDIAMIELPE